MVILANDHRGYKLKEKIKNILKKQSVEVLDTCPNYVEADDYPEITKMACARVLENQNNYGIFICGTGTGMNIVANKIKGIRATETSKVAMVKLAREKNNCNVLCVGANFIWPTNIKKLINVFLKTEFSKEKRHINRVANMES